MGQNAVGDSGSERFTVSGGFFAPFNDAAAVTQSVSLNAGWNMISLYAQPADPAVGAVLSPIQSDMVLIKNGNGEIYWPVYGVDQIGTWSSEQGYQIYMNSPASLSVTGSEINPAQTPIALAAGWNLVSYLSRTAKPVETALAGISGDLYLVKDGDGQVYWPTMGINNIGNMQPGLGYQIYMSSTANLVYP